MLSAPINRLTKWNVIRAERLFQKFCNKIIIIAPSNWIKLVGNDSFILKNIQITPVLNIHTEPKNLELLLNDRKKIRTEKKIALGVASMQKQSTIKGGKILEKLEQVIKSENMAAELLYLADFQTENHSPHLFWSSIDYLLVTSKIDNSPNVIHEAKMLGIPVIATNVGGIPELLNVEYDYLVKLNDQVLEQITKILKGINENPNSVDANQIIENYKIYSEKSLISLLELYDSLFESEN
jgi:hypothetical protein